MSIHTLAPSLSSHCLPHCPSPTVPLTVLPMSPSLSFPCLPHCPSHCPPHCPPHCPSHYPPHCSSHVPLTVLTCPVLSSVAQKHCKQQVENLTQQLIQKATRQNELETDNVQFQSRIKKLERYMCIVL